MEKTERPREATDKATWKGDDPAERALLANGKRESKRANQALRDYLLMGSARSLRKLLAHYKTDQNAPTRSLNTLCIWSGDFGWVERANRFDTLENSASKAAYENRRNEIMQNGVALTHERVSELKNLYGKLNDYLKDENNIWMPDKKSVRVGTKLVSMGKDNYKEVGEYEIVDLVAFNAPLFGKILETLEALAAETGGRVRKSEVTGKNGGPIRTAAAPVNLAALSNEDLDALEEIIERAGGTTGTDASGNTG